MTRNRNLSNKSRIVKEKVTTKTGTLRNDHDQIDNMSMRHKIKIRAIRFEALRNLYFISKFEQMLIERNLPLKQMHTFYGGFQGKFYSLKSLHPELTDVRVGNLLCSSAMKYNNIVSQYFSCPCCQDLMYEDNKKFIPIFNSSDDKFFIDLIISNKIDEENPGFYFVGENKDSVNAQTVLTMRFD